MHRLGEEPPDDYSAMSAEERVALVAQLSARVQELAGQTLTPLRRDLIRVRPLGALAIDDEGNPYVSLIIGTNFAGEGQVRRFKP